MANHSVATEAHWWLATEVIPATQGEGARLSLGEDSKWVVAVTERQLPAQANKTHSLWASGKEGHCRPQEHREQFPNPSQMWYSTPETISGASAMCQVQAQLFIVSTLFSWEANV